MTLCCCRCPEIDPLYCCRSEDERRLRIASDALFDVVNSETNCCGYKDDALSQTETMLLFAVLRDESRTSLRGHSSLIALLMQRLQAATGENTEGGRDISRYELRRAVLSATSAYQREAIATIAAELARDYERLAVNPMSMERGMAANQGGQRLLPS